MANVKAGVLLRNSKSLLSTARDLLTEATDFEFAAGDDHERLRHITAVIRAAEQMIERLDALNAHDRRAA